MWSQLGAEQVQGHLKVIRAFITRLAINLVHVIAMHTFFIFERSPGYIALIRQFNAHKIVTMKAKDTSGSRTALFTNDLNPVIAKLGETCCSRTALFNFFSVQRPIATKLGSKNHWPKTNMWVYFGWGRRSSRGQYGSFCNEHLARIASLHCPIATKLKSKNRWPFTHMWVNFGWDWRLFRGQ